MIKYILIAIVILIVIIGSIIFIKYKKKPEEVTIEYKKIIFNTNCEEKISDIILKKDEQIPSLPTLTRNGYNFKGWFLDPDFTKPLNKQLFLEDDLTVYAKWEEQSINDFLNSINTVNIQKEIIKKVRSTLKK